MPLHCCAIANDVSRRTCTRLIVLWRGDFWFVVRPSAPPHPFDVSVAPVSVAGLGAAGSIPVRSGSLVTPASRRLDGGVGGDGQQHCGGEVEGEHRRSGDGAVDREVVPEFRRFHGTPGRDEKPLPVVEPLGVDRSATGDFESWPHPTGSHTSFALHSPPLATNCRSRWRWHWPSVRNHHPRRTTRGAPRPCPRARRGRPERAALAADRSGPGRAENPRSDLEHREQLVSDGGIEGQAQPVASSSP